MIRQRAAMPKTKQSGGIVDNRIRKQGNGGIPCLEPGISPAEYSAR